ncbi:hypothetical protein MchiMG62_14160 [Methanoculleus chikugoensis]|uniref:Archaeal Type IV pilin N-terminal domain-containing protein n=2 Tax=Methanoculleus chikugoensis TaxID=118126 RepID=A0ABM7H689_9EURY|nr:hypothetical protein MchiMG62_14160 [Methanoculleus chikugoensis]
MNFRENEEAVSPVIGVILMVAITVILAAVIAAFVFGMTGNVQTTKTVAVTAHVDDNKYLVVTFQGGADAGSVENLNLTINGSGTADTNNVNTPKIGQSFKSTGTVVPGDCHAVVVATFKDGSSQVVLERQF